MKKILATFALATVAVLSAGRADAALVCTNAASECQFSFNQPVGGPYGTLTLDLLVNYNNTGKNAIKFTIDLVPGAFLVNTGNPDNHEPFTFNYAGTLTLSNFSVAGFFQGTTPPIDMSPYGSYNQYVTSNCQGGGPCAALGANDLTFIATTASGFNGLADVISGSTPFSADILFGSTFLIGTGADPTIVINQVPEPQTSAMLGSGLVALAFAARKLRRK